MYQLIFSFILGALISYFIFGRRGSTPTEPTKTTPPAVLVSPKSAGRGSKERKTKTPKKPSKNGSKKDSGSRRESTKKDNPNKKNGSRTKGTDKKGKKPSEEASPHKTIPTIKKPKTPRNNRRRERNVSLMARGNEGAQRSGTLEDINAITKEHSKTPLPKKKNRSGPLAREFSRSHSATNLLDQLETQKKNTPSKVGPVQAAEPRINNLSSSMKGVQRRGMRGHKRVASVSTYSRDTEALEDICLRFSDRENGVKLKTIKRKFRKGKIRVQKNVFSGEDGVDWLLRYVDGVTNRESAIHLGLSIWATGFFRHIRHPHRPFCDEPAEYFRFSRDEKKPTAKQQLRESLLKDHHPTPMDLHDTDSSTKDWMRMISGWVQVHCDKLGGWEQLWCKLEEISEETENGGADKYWELCLFNDIEDDNLISLVVQMHDKETGLKYHARDRLSRKTIISDKVCFQGRSAVKWCLNQGRANNRMEAVNIMTSLLSKGIISPLDSDQYGPFQDKKDILYFFTKFAEGKRRWRSVAGGSGLLVKKTLDLSAGTKADRLATFVFRSDKNILLKLVKGKGKIQVVLYHEDLSPLKFQETTDNQLMEDTSKFKIQMKEKDDLRVKNWVFALQMAILFSEPHYVHNLAAGAYDMLPSMEDSTDENSDEISHDTLDEKASEEDDSDVDEIIVEKDSSDEGSSGDSGKKIEAKEKKKKKKRKKKKKKWQAKPELLNAAEKAVLIQMKRKIAQEKSQGEYEKTGYDLTKIKDRELIKYLRARRLDVDQGLVLLKSGVAYRAENGLTSIKINQIFQEICNEDGKAMVLLDPKARDRDGRMVIIIYTEFYNPRKTSGQDIVRALYYLIEAVYEEDEESERHGFTLIVDCKNSKYSNFDPRMPGQVIGGVVGKFPARVGHIILVNTPWYFKFVWRIIKSLLSAYLVQKFHIVSSTEAITEWVAPKNLLPVHGGTAEYDFEGWVRHRFKHDGLSYEDFAKEKGTCLQV